METPSPDSRPLAQVLSLNVRRIRLLRGVSIHELAARMSDLGVSMTGSGLSKLESGAREGISIATMAAVTTALNAPMTSLAVIPLPDDRDAWSPRHKSDQRDWAAPSLVKVEIAQDVYVPRDGLPAWLAGSPMLSAALPWLTAAGPDEFMDLAPRDEQVRHAVFRHPAVLTLSVLEGAIREVLLGGSNSSGGREPIGVTREGMAAHLRDNVQRLEKYVDLMADEVINEQQPGSYLDEAAVADRGTHG